MQISRVLSILSIAIILGACSTTQTEEINIEEQLVASGPFFAGGNSFMATHSVDLSKLVSQKELSADDIKSVKITGASATLSNDADYSFSNFNNASLQMVSDNSPMTSIAVLNPIPDGSTNSIDFSTSKEAELSDLFKQEEFTLLLDLDFVEDDYRDQMETTLSINLIVEYK